MTVLVNEKPKKLPEASDLGHLLHDIGIEAGKGLAVAVNGTIVPMGRWLDTPLFENDQVLVVQATQGG